MNISDDLFPPPVSFYFNVVFFINAPISVPFLEINGLGVEMETEELKEGGENSFAYHLPTRAKHSNLVMKRPIAPVPRDLLEFWSSMSLQGEFITSVTPVNVSIYLMDANKMPVSLWYVTNAYPVKWDCTPLASDKNSLAIETLELNYQKIIHAL